MAANPSDDPPRMIQQIARRDWEAFERVYNRYAPLIFTFAVRLLQNRSDAEDLVQEVFLQVWREAETYCQDRGSPEAWLLTITRSRATDMIRKHQGIVRLLAKLFGATRPRDCMPAELPLIEAEVGQKVREALAKLSEEQRTALEIAYFGMLTQSEVAARLQLPLGTVKTRMRAGLHRLKELLGGLRNDSNGGEFP